MDILFIVGSPRSGTTILGDLLKTHPDLAHFHEPYFIWDHHLGHMDDDRRTQKDVTPEIENFVRREFEIFLDKSGRKILVEKSPRNSLKIPYINKIFPEAKWVHLLRDGRDVTLSINREWGKINSVVGNKSLGGLLKMAKYSLSHQPYLRNKIQSLLFAFRNDAGINPFRMTGNSKWGGRAGFGPRFPMWEKAIDNLDLVGFNAMQWQSCVTQIMEDFAMLDKNKTMELRYENMIANPSDEISKLLDFINVDSSPAKTMGNKLYKSNSGRWKEDLSKNEIESIGKVIGDLLIKLGYATDKGWYEKGT